MYIVVIRLDLRHIFFSSCSFAHSIEATHRSFSFALSAHCFDMCSSSSLFFARCCCSLYRILFRSVRFSRERLVVRCHYLNDILSLCAWKHNSTRRWLYLLCSTCSSVAALFFRFKTTCVWPPNSSEEQVRNSSCYFTFCDNNVFSPWICREKKVRWHWHWQQSPSEMETLLDSHPFQWFRLSFPLFCEIKICSQWMKCVPSHLCHVLLYMYVAAEPHSLCFFRHRLHILLLLLSICLLTQ